MTIGCSFLFLGRTRALCYKEHGFDPSLVPLGTHLKGGTHHAVVFIQNGLHDHRDHNPVLVSSARDGAGRLESTRHLSMAANLLAR